MSEPKTDPPRDSDQHRSRFSGLHAQVYVQLVLYALIAAFVLHLIPFWR